MKEVLRMCIICRQMKDRNSMIRIVKSKGGFIQIEKDKKIEGRGAYICKCDACLDKLEKTKAINRAFKMQVENKIYEEVLKLKEF